MRILIFIPHDSLIGPQGAMQRLHGLQLALNEHTLCYLVPDSAPKDALTLLGSAAIYFYREPGIGRRKIPYLLDFSSGWVNALERVVESERIDLTIFNFPWGLSRAAGKMKPPAVYFSHGVEQDFADITLRHLGLSRIPGRQAFRWLIGALERRACHAAASIVTMSGADNQRIAELYSVPKTKLYDLPQPIELSVRPERSGEFRARADAEPGAPLVVFHGSWQHLPNREAVGAIRETIAPRVAKAVPDVRFIVAGSGVPQFRDGSVTGIGYVSNLAELLADCDAGVMPIFSGCGVRMKVFDYFQAGVPCVSTKKGIEGLPVSNRRELLITSDDALDFSERLAGLLADPALQRTLREQAAAYLEAKHQPARLQQGLSAHLNACLQPEQRIDSSRSV